MVESIPKSLARIMKTTNLHLVYWLVLVSAAILLMIIVGGATRLTESGLSMVDWRPIMGVVPPLSHSDWSNLFETYKQFPEYKKLNEGMSLDAFKAIFYWEYGHRVLGRLIGVLFFVPFLYFLMRGKIERRWRPRLWIALGLGGCQGLMGWYMVQSGLVDIPHVSHFRLAAHLLLAIFILGFILWLILDMLEIEPVSVKPSFRNLVLGLAVVMGFQLMFGAFTAGLDAGKGFNTYPLMNGQFIADIALSLDPVWKNFIENGAMIQFVHRWLGAVVFFGVIILGSLSLKTELKGSSFILVLITAFQFILGVMTLVNGVPIVLGSLHQVVAVIMFLALVYLVYVTRLKTM